MWIFTLFWQVYPEHRERERQGSHKHYQTPDRSHAWSLSWVEACFTGSAADISDTRVCTTGNTGDIKRQKRDSLRSRYKFSVNSLWKNSKTLQNMQEKSSPIWDETSLHNSNREPVWKEAAADAKKTDITEATQWSHSSNSRRRWLITYSVIGTSSSKAHMCISLREAGHVTGPVPNVCTSLFSQECDHHLRSIYSQSPYPWLKHL